VIGLLQRVLEASVRVEGEIVGTIGRGLLVLVCAEPDDTPAIAGKLVDRLLGYRVFSDDAGKMNRSLRDIGGGLLLVPQFTLAADTHKGTRPSFSGAAAPALGRAMFDHALAHARAQHPTVASGVFGADMKVALINDGPVTFWLDVRDKSS
jgi:D-tyrosyl-tRNA(Tyr) deacylase